MTNWKNMLNIILKSRVVTVYIPVLILGVAQIKSCGFDLNYMAHDGSFTHKGISWII